MLVRSSFEVQHIHAVFASFSGKSLFRGLGLPGGLPARIQSYPRNSGLEASRKRFPGYPGTPRIAVSKHLRIAHSGGSRIAGLEDP
jgi:hypothetical protein